MPFTVKVWKNSPDTSTPLTAAALMDLETRLSAYTDSQAASTPLGSIVPYAGTAAPANWLMCDGSTANRTVYAGLFAVLGTRYGSGDGSTTFNLPDLRGRSVIGVGAGAGLTARLLNDTGGFETVTLTSDQSGMPAHSTANGGVDHTHTWGAWTGTDTPDHAHNVTGTGWSFTYAGGSTGSYTVWANYGAFGSGGATARHQHYVSGSTSGSSAYAHLHTVGATNASSSHTNMPPYTALNMIIRAQ